MKILLTNLSLCTAVLLSFHHHLPVLASGGDLAIVQENGAQQEDFGGRYTGNINGTNAAMQLQQDGFKISGTIDASGYIYRVSGTANGHQFTGQLHDPQTQGTLQCQGMLNNDVVQLTISTQDQFSGQAQQFQLHFTRGSDGFASAGDTAGDNTDKAGGSGYDHDPQLIGNWLYSESYSSGGYGFASQWRLIVNADGSYLYGDGKVAGGGPGVGGASGGGGYTRGQWGTQNGTIYINEGYGWQPYAGYYIEGTSMLMKFADGSKQVWKRTY